jgi:archaellum component FlaG (FlaF/FlaG flagellin family)
MITYCHFFISKKLIECSLIIEQQQKMMTRSKTAANAAKTEKAIVNEPKEAEAVAVESNMDNDKTVVYPSMFDRWREPL